MISWDAAVLQLDQPTPDADPGLPVAAPQPPTAKRINTEIALFVAVAAGFVLVLHFFVVEVRWIPSGSMLDQLHVHDRVAVSKLSYRLHEPRRGDIVVFEPPGQPPDPPRALPVRLLRSIGEGLALVRPSSDDYIKRVIGLPGEVVEGRRGHVYVNGRLLVEPYLDPGMTTSDFPPTPVPEGALWLMGDNRPNSSDSRVFGPVSRSAVVGRAVVRIWPPLRVSFL